jgi:hypothetical protein
MCPGIPYPHLGIGALGGDRWSHDTIGRRTWCLADPSRTLHILVFAFSDSRCYNSANLMISKGAKGSADVDSDINTESLRANALIAVSY